MHRDFNKLRKGLEKKDASGIGPHGPVSPQFMKHYYGATKGSGVPKCDVCGTVLEFPADNDPRYEGDTAVTSKCRHTIKVRPITGKANQ